MNGYLKWGKRARDGSEEKLPLDYPRIEKWNPHLVGYLGKKTKKIGKSFLIPLSLNYY